jgi:hypothetical protein
MVDYTTDTVLADRDNATYVSRKVRYMWHKDILQQILGEDVLEFLPEEELEQTVEQKMKLRSFLRTNGLYVESNTDGTMRIYTKPDDNDWLVIADWKIPQFKLVYDYNQIEKDKKWFVEITIEHWSVFNEHED